MKKLISLLMSCVMFASLTACSKTEPSSSQPEPVEVFEGASVNLGLLKGPTGMGAVYLLGEDAETVNDYNWTLFSSPADVTAKIISGELDIAAVPTNLASTLYSKTQGGVQIIALNTFGTLYVVTTTYAGQITSPADLEGKTILLAGQGSTPEYALNYILEYYGLKDKVSVEFAAEHAEAVAKLASGDADIVVLPEPNVSAAIMQANGAEVALNLGEIWKEISEDSGELAMGSVIVRKAYADENPEAVKAFLTEYEKSIISVNENIDEARDLCRNFEIVPKAPLAKQAIPRCGLRFVCGSEMKTITESYLSVLFNYNPQSVGGKLPDAEFYF